MKFSVKYWSAARRCSCGALDGDRVHSVLDHRRTDQTIGATARQPSDCFFRSLFGFLVILPLVLSGKGHHAFRTTHPDGHFLRGAVGVAATVAGFYATTRLPLTDSTAISFTAPLFMILTAIFVLGEKVRWRRGLATIAGFIGVLVIVRPDSGALDEAAMIGLLGALLVAFSTTLLKRQSAAEEALMSAPSANSARCAPTPPVS
jgi:drug/metabolite transporter (DMT)-like permease